MHLWALTHTSWPLCAGRFMVKKNRVCILPVCPLCHLALCKKFHHVSAIPPICESVWVCMWMCRWDKVCKCIQAFPAASAAVIRYWFIVTVAMATPDWNTNPTETVRTWNHIAQPSDDWQALFLWVMARDEVGQQRINATEVHSYAFFCQVQVHIWWQIWLRCQVAITAMLSC